MPTLSAGINSLFWVDPNPGRLFGSLLAGEKDLRTTINSSNTKVIYEVTASGYRSYSPANPNLAPFNTLLKDKSYIIETFSAFNLDFIRLPTDDFSANEPTPVYDTSITAIGANNQASSSNVGLSAKSGDVLTIESKSSGSFSSGSLSLYVGSISEANQVAMITFIGAYAGSRFSYRVKAGNHSSITTDTTFTGSNLKFAFNGEIILS